MKRTLSLKRDALAELDAAGLRSVAAGGDSQLGSCLDFVSCYILDCVRERTKDLTTAVDTLDC